MMESLTEVYQALGLVGLLTIVAVWWIMTQTNSQKKQQELLYKQMTKTNDSILCMFKDEVKETKDNTIENRRLNKDSVELIKQVSIIQEKIKDALVEVKRNMYDNDMNSRNSWKLLIESLQNLCGMLDGENPTIIKIKKDLNEIKENL